MSGRMGLFDRLRRARGLFERAGERELEGFDPLRPPTSVVPHTVWVVQVDIVGDVHLDLRDDHSDRADRSVTEGPRIVEAWTEDGSGARNDTFRRGDAMVLRGTASEPDDRPPVLLFGVVRADGTPVFGSHSNERGYVPARMERTKFGFAVRFDSLALLPGKYNLRVHALDPEGLRLHDTLERDFVVTGETRDYGVVELEHRWLNP